MNEPAAYMTKEGYAYGKHETRPIDADIPLYTKPFFQQKPVAMMVKMDGFDKPEFTTICSSATLKHPNYTALYDHPMPNETLDTRSYLIGRYDKVRELTDEEIDYITKKYFNIHPDAKLSEQFKIKLYELEDFARAILKKANVNK